MSTTTTTTTITSEASLKWLESAHPSDWLKVDNIIRSWELNSEEGAKKHREALSKSVSAEIDRLLEGQERLSPMQKADRIRSCFNALITQRVQEKNPVIDKTKRPIAFRIVATGENRIWNIVASFLTVQQAVSIPSVCLQLRLNVNFRKIQAAAKSLDTGAMISYQRNRAPVRQPEELQFSQAPSSFRFARSEETLKVLLTYFSGRTQLKTFGLTEADFMIAFPENATNRYEKLMRLDITIPEWTCIIPPERERLPNGMVRFKDKGTFCVYLQPTQLSHVGSNCPNLEKLTIRNIKSSDRLLGLLHHCKKLKELTFVDCFYHAEGLGEQLVKLCPSLERVNGIQEYFFDDFSGTNLLKEATISSESRLKSLEKNTGLQKLTLTGAFNSDVSFPNLPGLQELHLHKFKCSHYGYSDKTPEFLAAAAKALPWLSTIRLNLSCVDMDAVLKELSSFQKLKTIIIYTDEESISDKGLEILSKHPSLTTLELRGNTPIYKLPRMATKSGLLAVLNSNTIQTLDLSEATWAEVDSEVETVAQQKKVVIKKSTISLLEYVLNDKEGQILKKYDALSNLIKTDAVNNLEEELTKISFHYQTPRGKLAYQVLLSLIEANFKTSSEDLTFGEAVFTKGHDKITISALKELRLYAIARTRFAAVLNRLEYEIDNCKNHPLHLRCFLAYINELYAPLKDKFKKNVKGLQNLEVIKTRKDMLLILHCLHPNTDHYKLVMNRADLS